MSANLPLTALRAFEVAARSSSYTRAAEELHVTHGAISHQMRLLEEELGVALFERVGREMRLTAAGAELANEVRASLDRMARAFEQARRSFKPGRITVSVLPQLASYWLVPRLTRFYARAPDLEVSLRVSESLANFKTDGVDVALRYGGGRWPGTTAIRLLREEIFAVCSPAFRKKHGLRNPQQLAQVPLLRNTNIAWVPYFRSLGLDWPEPTRGTLYDDTSTAIRAAAEGHGVALARRVTASELLAAKRLTRLFERSIPDEWAYYVVYPGDGDPPRHIAPFVGWLLEEAGTSVEPGRKRTPAVQ